MPAPRLDPVDTKLFGSELSVAQLVVPDPSVDRTFPAEPAVAGRRTIVFALAVAGGRIEVTQLPSLKSILCVETVTVCDVSFNLSLISD
jgi:hypothetical protein